MIESRAYTALTRSWSSSARAKCASPPLRHQRSADRPENGEGRQATCDCEHRLAHTTLVRPKGNWSIARRAARGLERFPGDGVLAKPRNIQVAMRGVLGRPIRAPAGATPHRSPVMLPPKGRAASPPPDTAARSVDARQIAVGAFRVAEFVAALWAFRTPSPDGTEPCCSLLVVPAPCLQARF
jgi:hypothetical protein